MKRIRLTRLLALLGLALFLAACGREPKLQPLPTGTAVLAFGDSVTFGTGAKPGEDYPTRLAALTGWNITNAGIPGDTAENARQRISAALKDLPETRYALVIIEIGGNDFLRRRAEGPVKEDIRRIIATVREAGAQPFLVAVPRFSVIGAAVGSLPDAALYAELAKEEKLPLAAGTFAEVLADTGLRADAVHPNEAGYRKLAEGIAAALKDSALLQP